MNGRMYDISPFCCRPMIRMKDDTSSLQILVRGGNGGDGLRVFIALSSRDAGNDNKQLTVVCEHWCIYVKMLS